MLLVRHGCTPCNVARKLQGNAMPGPGLTEQGIQQSRCVGKCYKDAVDCIYTSPLRRCTETLRHILSESGKALAVIEDDGLKERDLGEFTGCTIDGDIRQRMKRSKDVESIDELICRSKATMQRILQDALERDLEHVMVLSHGGFISSVARFVDPNTKYCSVSNGSVSRLVAYTCTRHGNIQWKIDAWNQTLHLEHHDGDGSFGGGSLGG